MIAIEPAQKVRDAIAENIGVKEVGEGVYIVDVPWSFPDGDQCRVFVSKSDDGNWTVTDGGSSVMRASYAGEVDVLGRGYVERFRQIAMVYGLREDEGELLAEKCPNIGDAVFAVSQASIDVVHLARLPKERSPQQKSRFAEKLSNLIGSHVSADHFQHNWTDDAHDADHFYPVTYRIEPSRGKEVLLWGVRTSMSCNRALASCLFHKLHRSFRGTAIYANKSDLPQTDVERLDQQVERSFSSLRDAASLGDYLSAQID